MTLREVIEAIPGVDDTCTIRNQEYVFSEAAFNQTLESLDVTEDDELEIITVSS